MKVLRSMDLQSTFTMRMIAFSIYSRLSPNMAVCQVGMKMTSLLLCRCRQLAKPSHSTTRPTFCGAWNCGAPSQCTFSACMSLGCSPLKISTSACCCWSTNRRAAKCSAAMYRSMHARAQPLGREHCLGGKRLRIFPCTSAIFISLISCCESSNPTLHLSAAICNMHARVWPLDSKPGSGFEKGL